MVHAAPGRFFLAHCNKSVRIPFMKVTVLSVLFFIFPYGVAAAVFVSEIAWMGDMVSANNEWIELANNGNVPVDLSGWTLAAADGSPAITLSGTIASGGYFLLERTGDGSVPGITADMIYTGALSNAGETLVLRDATGVAHDTIGGGENWSNIGGDNITKDTAQRIAVGWVTMPPTPRAANANGDSSAGGSGAGGEVLGMSASPGDRHNESGSNETMSVGRAVPSPFPRATITVNAGEDVDAFAGFLVAFNGEALGFYDEPLSSSATYQWNFGDGATALGKTATHTYIFPGEYIVTLEVFWGGKREQDRVTVTVTNADIAIAKMIPGADGYLEIKNASSREIAVESWRLVEGEVQFIIPAHTFIPSGKTLLLPNQNSRLRGMTAVTLENRDGFLLAKWEPQGGHPANIPIKTSAVRSSVAEATVVSHSSASTSSRNTANPSPETLWERAESETAASMLSGRSIFSWPLFAIFVAFAALALFLLRRGTSQESSADQYAIIEEMIEGEESERTSASGAFRRQDPT